MKTISFFSYKGGAGRSTLAYNVIPILAAEHVRPTAENPIIVVDTDVDSCGMSYLVKADNDVNDDNCIQQLLSSEISTNTDKYPSIEDHPFLSKLIPVGNAYGYKDNDAVLLLPAKDNKTIIEDSKSNYTDSSSNPFRPKMNDFLYVCEQYGVPMVIFDSSVGNTALANISNEIANVIVCVMRPTTQFVNGTRRYLLGVENGEKMFEFGKHIVLVPNVIPQEEVVINGLKYPDGVISKIRIDFSNDFTENSFYNYHFDMLDKEEFGIPAVKRFMWIEDALYTKPSDELNENEKEALGRYRKLARIISEIESGL